jgi:hypothetical protein
MSGEINVVSRTQIIVVEPVSKSVAIINAGPPGPNSNQITVSNTPPSSPGINDLWIDTT